MDVLRILIAEDTNDIAENISDYLEIKGHETDFANNGVKAVELATSNKYDAILMDIMMPRFNGLEATKKIRQSIHSNVPILMLTAKEQMSEKIEGLSSGADDYIVKPFDMEEVYARIQAQVRKYNNDYNAKLLVSGMELNDLNETITLSSNTVKLKPSNYKILKLLAKNYPNIVKKAEIEFLLWGDILPEKDILRSHIYNLRKTLSEINDAAKIISKHGQGYKLLIDDESSTL